MEIEGRKIVIIGLGKTGRAAGIFLARRGARIVVTDEKPSYEMEDVLRDLRQSGGDVAWAPYDAHILSGADLVVPSPGVPPTHEILAAAIRRDIPILSELEIAGRFLTVPMIAITGTNGKTTTTALTGHILGQCGKKVFVGGNIGTPLIEYVDGPQGDDYAVVEVSSFQLQWVETFHPHVAALLNTTPDHVDYHGSFAAYRAAKEKIFEKQTSADFAIVNTADEGTEKLRERLPARVLRFNSSTEVTDADICIDHEQIVYRPDRERYPLAMIGLPGRHNVENVMVALAIARICGCSPSDITTAVERFKGMSHRIEWAGRVGGVDYYDDSKGTNVDAVRRAMETFAVPVVLLMGGRDKEGDFASLTPDVKENVKTLVLFGEARESIRRQIGGIVKTIVAATLREAISVAGKEAAPGEVVLLSPGCASFDEFKDYKERGDFFKRTVQGMADV